MSSAPLRLSRVSSAIAISFALAAAPAAAAGYLKLGDIKGEAAASGHGGEIHIESFSWGATQARVGGKMHQEDISVAPSADGAKGGNVEYEWKVEEGESAPPGTTRPTSVKATGSTPAGTRKATPKLSEAVAKGKVFKSPAPKGSLTTLVPAGTCRAGARYPTAELGAGERVYTMTGVVVIGCTAARSSGRPMESLSLNYEKIVWK